MAWIDSAQLLEEESSITVRSLFLLKLFIVRLPYVGVKLGLSYKGMNKDWKRMRRELRRKFRYREELYTGGRGKLHSEMGYFTTVLFAHAIR
jgi:hypothetical protein